ncbi:MAG TPA: penicillin-binding transpeptidase domain-containing protein, partial [Agriterribacter sp.]|nr:penicillin-binding transpeptidase domain-containing protein [Agriterribacter sp.]
TTEYNKDYRGSWNSCTNVTLGIGQDKMQVTPLQLANAMCIIANKGYYYTPHFVERIEDETAKDTLLNKFREKHPALTHISDQDYEVIHAGMQDVVESGTARSARIPGITICAKTGTSEKYTILDGKRIKLPNNSMFVCFAPRENPKIAIAVAVENAGFGSTWASPIASFLIEKYVTDSIRTDRMKDVERISNTNLMPSYLKRKQFIADSTRAYFYFNLRKDSSYIKKYLRGYTGNEKKPVKVVQPVKVKTPEDSVERVTGRSLQKRRDTAAGDTVSDTPIIQIKKPVRRYEAEWRINNDKQLKNQATR